MPNLTPRKTRQRHQNQHSQSQAIPVPVQASDYDSEAFFTEPSAPTRTRDDINFSVLRRYVPSLALILTHAPSCTVYRLLDGDWNRAEIEGSLFICQLTPSPFIGTPRNCLILLNRKGTKDLIIEYEEIAFLEIAFNENGKFLMLGYKTKENGIWVQPPRNSEMKCLGLFLHCDESPSMDEILDLIVQTYEEGLAEKQRVEEQQDDGMETAYEDEAIERDEEQTRAMGRRLSISELFGRR